MRINKRGRVSHRTPYNRDSKIHIAKQNIGDFFRRYKRALKKRNIRTIIFTAAVFIIFIVLPIILAITFSGPKQAETKTDDVPSQDAQVVFSDPSDISAD